MITLHERMFSNRTDKACEICGERPATFQGYADIENGPHPLDLESGIWIDGKLRQWVCDSCEHHAWIRAHEAADAICLKLCGPVCVMNCYADEDGEDQRS